MVLPGDAAAEVPAANTPDSADTREAKLAEAPIPAPARAQSAAPNSAGPTQLPGQPVLRKRVSKQKTPGVPARPPHTLPLLVRSFMQHSWRPNPPLRRESGLLSRRRPNLQPARADTRPPRPHLAQVPGTAARACPHLTPSRPLRARGPATGTRATGLQERPRGCPTCTSSCLHPEPTVSAARSNTSTPPFALTPVLLLTSRAVSASTEHGPSGCLGRPLTVTQEISQWTRPSPAGFPAPQLPPP